MNNLSKKLESDKTIYLSHINNLAGCDLIGLIEAFIESGASQRSGKQVALCCAKLNRIKTSLREASSTDKLEAMNLSPEDYALLANCIPQVLADIEWCNRALARLAKVEKSDTSAN